MLDNIKEIIPAIHKEGHIFIIIFFLITAFFFLLSPKLGWIGVVLSAWCIFFFRDPVRVTPVNDDLVISPADGLVQMITKAPTPPELKMDQKEMTRVSIFLNVFDVHVNRSPVTGEVHALHYHEGKFFNASLDKASIHNERQAVWVKTKDGKDVAFTQIAGLVARRIVCDLKKNQKLKSGERFGIIRFGSRMDIFLPDGVEPNVIVGQRAIGGETIIANLKGKQVKVKGRKD